MAILPRKVITQNLIFLNWYQHAKNKAISNDLIWRFQSSKNTAIWLAESILAHISGTRFLPNIDYVQKYRLWNSHYRHSWQRFLTHLFYEDPPPPPPHFPPPPFSTFPQPPSFMKPPPPPLLYCLPPLFQILPIPSLPISTLAALFVEWFFGLMGDRTTFDKVCHIELRGRKNGKLCRRRSFFIKCVTIWWGVILTIIKISMACM